jgi:hypothetical protein
MVVSEQEKCGPDGFRGQDTAVDGDAGTRTGDGSLSTNLMLPTNVGHEGTKTRKG